MSDSTQLPARYENGRFGPGNPGRPVGSYNRASRRAALTILAHFEATQEQFLERLAQSKDLYIALLARVLPKQIVVGACDVEAMSDAEVAEAFVNARVLLDGAGDRRIALSEMQAVLQGESAARRAGATVNNGD
ncbi:MAG TPA: hypothetical protein VGH15_11615 [Caulobacteraceae bacterium]